MTPGLAELDPPGGWVMQTAFWRAELCDAATAQGRRRTPWVTPGLAELDPPGWVVMHNAFWRAELCDAALMGGKR